MNYFRKFMLLAAFGVIAAAQMKADPICTANTLAFYESNITTSSNGCSIGGLNFFLFNGTNAGTTTSGPGSTPFDATQIEVTPLSGAGGSVGFVIAPISTNGFQATQTGARDVEIPFQVSCANGTACLSNVFMSFSGSATGTASGGLVPGQSLLTETYCIGGISPPATPPCNGGPVTQDKLFITPTSGSTVSQTDSFSPVTQLSITKDASAVGMNGTATITSIEDLFQVSSVPTPEPSTILLLSVGLAGLAFLSGRKRLAR